MPIDNGVFFIFIISLTAKTRKQSCFLSFETDFFVFLNFLLPYIILTQTSVLFKASKTYIKVNTLDIAIFISIKREAVIILNKLINSTNLKCFSLFLSISSLNRNHISGTLRKDSPV